jgi:hypothetical protein
MTEYELIIATVETRIPPPAVMGITYVKNSSSAAASPIELNRRYVPMR